MRTTAVCVLVICLVTVCAGQSNPASSAARSWRQQHERPILDELLAFLAIPNESRDRAGIQRNAEFIVRMMEKRNIAHRVLSIPGGSPLVFGSLPSPGATRTIVFYAHYDGTSLDPKEWATPPYEPVFRNGRVEDGAGVMTRPPAGSPIDPEWRVYARSAADDKGPIVAMFAALDAMRAAGVAPKSNIQFVFDGEEEAGSPSLEKTLVANRALFAPNSVWLMCDGPVYQTREPLIVFGTRGVMTLDLTVYGPRSELHSGHYGNWAPNPALGLSRLLASMKDDDGKVLIPGFYDEVEPLSGVEKRAIAAAPVLDKQLLQDFWLGSAEGGTATLNELITRPSLNIRGLSSARTGAQASNVIPATATATIDIRLVKRMTIARTQQVVRDHLRQQGYFVVDTEPAAEIRRAHPRVVKLEFTRGAEAERTSMELPVSQEVIRTIESVRGPAVKLPTMGGQLPLGAIIRPFNVPLVVVPMVNHDNNQHGPDENLRIQNLWDGIELMAALLTM